jgi:hypothetical protein
MAANNNDDDDDEVVAVAPVLLVEKEEEARWSNLATNAQAVLAIVCVVPVASLGVYQTRSPRADPFHHHWGAPRGRRCAARDDGVKQLLRLMSDRHVGLEWVASKLVSS